MSRSASLRAPADKQTTPKQSQIDNNQNNPTQHQNEHILRHQKAQNSSAPYLDSDEWTCKAASNAKEATALIESRFEYVAQHQTDSARDILFKVFHD